MTPPAQSKPQTYADKDVTFTFGGQTMTSTRISLIPEPLEGPPEPAELRAKKYEASVTMTVEDRSQDPLAPLAWRSVVTPSLDAPETFAVLVDALLERGLITQRLEEEPQPFDEFANVFRRPESVLEQAWAWAKETAGPSFMDRLLALTKTIPRREPVPEVVATDPGEYLVGIDWAYRPPREERPERVRRGIGNAPLAMRFHLKPWERR